MTATQKIERISGEQTLTLRQNILRPNFSLNQCIYPEDSLESTYHFGLVEDGKILSVATFLPGANSALPFEAHMPYRLRGMATAKGYQGQNLGMQVLLFGLTELEKISCDLVWCNAREVAFRFYERAGFSYHGSLFDIDDIGPHKVMYKKLNPR